MILLTRFIDEVMALSLAGIEAIVLSLRSISELSCNSYSVTLEQI